MNEKKGIGLLKVLLIELKVTYVWINMRLRCVAISLIENVYCIEKARKQKRERKENKGRERERKKNFVMG